MTDLSLHHRRDLATELVDRLRSTAPAALDAGGVDLGPALETLLYGALRDGLRAGDGLSVAARRLARRAAPLAAAALALRPIRTADLPSGPILVVVRQPVHVRLLAPVREALVERGIGPVVVVRVSVAARDHALATAGPRLEAYLDRSVAGELLRSSGIRHGTLVDAWQSLVPDAAAHAAHTLGELPPLRAAALALRSAIRATGATVAATYDEVGRWGRLLAAGAVAERIRSVDLPHAEAVDEVAMRGIGFDRIAVFGAHSAERVANAGVERARIVEIGSPGLDALVERARHADPVEPRRLVFASQYVAGVMTAELKERTVAAAIAASAAAAPCETVIVPHPVERDDIVRRALAAPPPPGVDVRLAAAGTLHDELLGAWLLVTGSSQSVIEATAARVPSLTVNLTGGPDPVPYAAEGMALGASSAREAAERIASLLVPEARRRAVERGVAALERHVGPLDGRASARAADLLVQQAALGAGAG